MKPVDRLSDDGEVIIPGQIRTRDVHMGRHIPPTAASLTAFLKRLDDVSGSSRGGRILINTACAHHHVAWVHPVLDGNGRAARRQSHCSLWQLSEGLSLVIFRSTQDKGIRREAILPLSLVWYCCLPIYESGPGGPKGATQHFVSTAYSFSARCALTSYISRELYAVETALV